MTEILDTIDASLQEVEEQLLQEFDRIRNTLSDARFEAVDTGIRVALTSVVSELHQTLEQTGDVNNLQLMTERHEVLLARFAVLRQLLNAKVPTAFLHEAHKEVTNTRRELEAKVKAQRRRNETSNTVDSQDKSPGLMGKLKGMFSNEKQTPSTAIRNKISVTQAEQQALEPMNIYLDNGIYSASRELAALANVFSLPEQEKEVLQEVHEQKMRAVITGKARFESRDLSHKPPELREKKIQADDVQEEKNLASSPNSGEIAQTPDEIRKKLSERQGTESGKAFFTSKDIQHEEALERVVQPSNQNKATPQLTATEVAARRRADLEAEKAKQPTTGKASFVSKDIEPIVPQEAPRKRPIASVENEEKPAKEDTEQPRSGKAIFESRDLTSTPPTRKK